MKMAALPNGELRSNGYFLNYTSNENQEMMAQLTRFLSCDWGTTAFRLWLVELAGFKIIAEVSSKQGNSTVYEEWCKSSLPEEQRISFYLSVIRENIRNLEAQGTGTLDGVPVVISGMASSTIGMMEVPYKALPFALDGTDLSTKMIPASDAFPYPAMLISGAKTEDDVMRGEETQIVGCAIPNRPEEQLVIHPGTHSKHALVKNGRVVSFQTFLTGELFSLLGTKSILTSSVEEDNDFDTPDNRVHFDQGVKEGAANNLLHQLFLVRTADLFRKRSKTANYHYLSGLLIGYELTAFPQDYNGTIILAGSAVLVKKYKAAMELTGIIAKPKELILKDADEITIAGQYAVYSRQETKDQ